MMDSTHSYQTISLNSFQRRLKVQDQPLRTNRQEVTKHNQLQRWMTIIGLRKLSRLLINNLIQTQCKILKEEGQLQQNIAIGKPNCSKTNPNTLQLSLNLNLMQMKIISFLIGSKITRIVLRTNIDKQKLSSSQRYHEQMHYL